MAEILLLEDTRPLLRIMTHALREAGHSVTPVENGQITGHPTVLRSIDLMITDIDMPGVNGIEAIVAAKNANPHLKILAMSGAGMDDNDDYLSICKELGASELLLKPVDPDDLIEIVAGMMSSEACEG